VTPTRIRTLATAGAAGALAVWLLLRLAYTALPPPPWTGVPALLVLAAAETWSGRSVRARLRGRVPPAQSPPGLTPIAVARLAALAKASSLAGALITGLAAGFLLFVAGSLGKAAYRQDAYTAAGTLACALALTAAALYLEYGCRVPPSADAPPPGLP
jgi:Protein of unknown function (DUF3180)